MRSANVEIDEKVFPDSAFFARVERACVEIARRSLARAHDDHGSRFHDALFDPRQPKPETVSELSVELVALQLEDSRAYKLSEKHVDKQRAN